MDSPAGSDAGTLFVVDWEGFAPDDLQRWQQAVGTPLADWRVWNIWSPSPAYRLPPAGGGGHARPSTAERSTIPAARTDSPLSPGPAGRLGRLRDYWRAARWLVRHGHRFERVVVWQQWIGYLMCLLPTPPGLPRPRLIVTTVLTGPRDRPWPGVDGLALRLALRRAQALVWFSAPLADAARQAWPRWAAKIHALPLPTVTLETPSAAQSAPWSGPQSTSEPRAQAASNPTSKPPPQPAPSRTTEATHPPSPAMRPPRPGERPGEWPGESPGDGHPPRPLRVFAGGRSERDFDVVVDALAGTGMTLVLVCDAHVRLREATACDPAIEVHRDVLPEQFNALARGCDIVVVALRSTASPCGQLLLSFCMRERLALVVTESAGTRDYVIDGRTGLTVPVGDAAALRRACQRLAADPALRQRLLDQAEAFVATLSFSSFARSIDALPLDRRG